MEMAVSGLKRPVVHIAPQLFAILRDPSWFITGIVGEKFTPWPSTVAVVNRGIPPPYVSPEKKMTPQVYAHVRPPGILERHAAFTLFLEESWGEGEGAPPYLVAVAKSVTLKRSGENPGFLVGDALGGVGGVGDTVVGDSEDGKCVGLGVCELLGLVGACVGEVVPGTVLRHAHTARYAWLHSVTLAPNGELNHWYVWVPVYPTKACSTTDAEVHP